MNRFWLASFVLVLTGCGGEKATQPASPMPPPVPSPASAQPPPRALATSSAAAPQSTAPALIGPAPLAAKALHLPGVIPPASLDYLACDRRRGKIWVPVGNTGSVDVLDTDKGTFTRVDGFQSGEREFHGAKRIAGPSAAAVGDGMVYVGNRFSNQVCPVDAVTLKVGQCLSLPSRTDGLAYVPSMKEVWVTTPDDRTISVLDASRPERLRPKTVVKLDGSPEGYAIDDSRGIFYTNLEDKDATVVIDLKSHLPKATWQPGCGKEGPRGIATDATRGFVFVACTDHIVVLDARHDGAVLGKLDTGAGLDNIDWLEDRRTLYAAAAKAATLVVARVSDAGEPMVIGAGASAEGARNAVADAAGNAYLADPRNGGILVFAPAPLR